MKVLFRFDCSAALAARLASLPDMQVTVCSESKDAAYATLLPGTDVLWHVLCPVTRAAIESAPRLRLIQKIGVGVNTIDLAAARDHGIAVCNMPGTNSRAVAELTLALILCCLRHVVAFDKALKDGGGWSWPPDRQDDLREVAGKTVGLAGFGSVAALLAPILDAMGARVIYTSRTPKPDVAYEFVTKDDLLARSDVLSLHMPLTEETGNWLDRSSLARLKPGSVVVNVARGGLVEEAALVDALQGGAIRAAGLDVFATEPVDPQNLLLKLPNVVTLPHIAWLTAETLERSLAVAVENVRRIAAGRPLLYRLL